MTLRVCEDCSCAYAVGIDLCPHCGSERSREQGAETVPAASIHTEEGEVPKITRHAGPSVAGVRHPDDGPAGEPSGAEQGEAPRADQQPQPAAPSSNDGPRVHEDPGALHEAQEAAGVEPVDVNLADGLSEQPHVPTSEPANRPAVRDPKAAWVDYACSLGMVREAADELSKGDLIDVVKAVEDGTHRVAENGTVEAVTPTEGAGQ